PRALCERACDLAFGYDARRHPRLTHVKVGAGELVMLFHKEDLPDPPPRVSLEMMGDRDLIRLVNAGAVGTLFNKFIDQDKSAANILVQTYFVAAALVRRRAGFAIVDEY